MHELSLGWRSRVRIAVAALLTFGVGVVSATPDVAWPFRVVAALAFLLGAALCLDAVVFTSSWRFTSSALKVPTLLSRRREISGRGDLTVELRPRSRLVITGPNGTRQERINPLISDTDLRRWFDSTPD